MQRISPYFCEFVTLDTRANSKYFKDFANNNLNDTEFKKAVRQIEGRFDSPVLVTETIVSHYGYVNGNFRWYDPAYGKFNASTLVKPSPKPILKNHDRYEDALGRVIMSRYEDIDGLDAKQKQDLKTRKGYIKAFGYITGKDNVEKVMDERFLTVSIGGRSPEVKCSICQTNLINESCEHELGLIYDTDKGKKMAYLVYGTQEYVEYSYVNAPADIEARTQRHQLIAPQDNLTSDYAELVRATMKSEQAKPIESFDEDRYSAYMTDSNQSAYYSFDQARMLNKNDVFGVLAPEETSVNRGDAAPASQPPAKQNQTTSNEEDDAVDIKEATLDDLLKLGILKDHLATVRKEDSDAIAQLKKNIETKDEEVTTLKSELAGKDQVISEKDKEITKQQDDLKKYQDEEDAENVSTLVDLMIKLEKPSVKAIIDEKDEAKQKVLLDGITSKVAERSRESVADAIADLQAELAAIGAQDGNGITTIITDDVTKINHKTAGPAVNPISALLGKNKK